jgi:hypothetical protein
MDSDFLNLTGYTDIQYSMATIQSISGKEDSNAGRGTSNYHTINAKNVCCSNTINVRWHAQETMGANSRPPEEFTYRQHGRRPWTKIALPARLQHVQP